MPVRRQCARMAACSARVSVQPVGLLGALSTSRRVAGVTAASSASRSSTQAPLSATPSGTRVTWAPMISGCATRLGQAGVTTTTRSPASTSVCEASISPLTPPEVTAMRSNQWSVDCCGCRPWV